MSIRAIYNYCPTLWPLTGGLVCVTAAAEIGYRLLRDLNSKTRPSTDQLYEEAGRFLLFSLCATNIVPYSAVLGGTIFYLHSCVKMWQNPNKMYQFSLLLAGGTWYLLETVGPQVLKFLQGGPSIISLEKKDVWKVVAVLTAAIFFIKFC